MAIQYLRNALGGTTDTTTCSVTLPETAAGDLLIFEYCHRGTGTGTIGGTSVTTGGLTWNNKHDQLFGASAFSGHTYWTIATGNHSGQTVTASSLTNSSAGIVTVYSGTHQTTPLDDATVVGEQNASSDEGQAAITTTTGGAWVVLVVVNSPDLAVSSQAAANLTITERAERLSTGGTDASIAHASGELSAPGSSGAFTWAQTNAASGSWAYAIKPAPLAVSIDNGSLTITGQTVTTSLTQFGGNAWAPGAWASGAWASGAWDVEASGNLSLNIDTAGALTLAGQSVTAATSIATSEGSLTITGQSVLSSLNVALSEGGLTVSGETVTTDLTLDLFATIENGSLALDGQALTAALNVALSEGALTLDGQIVDASLSANFGVDIDTAGALTLAGQDATASLFLAVSEGNLSITGQILTADTDVALAHGSLTIDGQTVIPALGDNLAVGIDAGALTLDGQTATTDLSVALAAGALTVDGQEVTTDLTADLFVTIDAGSLTIDGQTVTASIPGTNAWASGAWAFGAWATNSWAGMEGPNNLSVDIDTAGALSIAGQATGFMWTVPWTEGQLTLTGQSLTASLNVAVDNGSLTIDGQTVDAALGDNLSVTIDAGALTLDGQSQAVSLSVALSEGSLTVDGQDVTLNVSEGLNVSIDAGSLTLDGQTLTTDLTNDLFVSVDAGSLTLDGQSVGVSTNVALSDGALTIAGQSVDSGLGLPVEAGSLTLSGEDLTTQISGSFEVEIEAGNLTISGESVTIDGLAEPQHPTIFGRPPGPKDRKKFKDWLERQEPRPLDVTVEAGTLSISGQEVDVRIVEPLDPLGIAAIAESFKSRPVLRLPKKKPVPVSIDEQIATELRYAEELQVQKRKRRRKQDDEILLLM